MVSYLRGGDGGYYTHVRQFPLINDYRLVLFKVVSLAFILLTNKTNEWLQLLILDILRSTQYVAIRYYSVLFLI